LTEPRHVVKPTFVGEKLMKRRPDGMTWHWAHGAGRMYKCDCMRAWRLGVQLVFPTSHARPRREPRRVRSSIKSQVFRRAKGA
jgi:hypothetical protein